MSEGEKPTRRFPRIRLSFETGLKSEVWQGDRKHGPAVITVLGAGGAFLDVNEYFDLGSTLGLCFTLPGSQARIVCGAVVRDQVLGPTGLGVEFVSLTPDDRQRLTDTVPHWPVSN